MRILLILFLFVSLPSFGQHEFMTWVNVGADGKFVKSVKKLKWEANACARIGEAGLQTFYPQVGVEYKVAKWFRPSVDYRLIIDKNKYGNYKSSNRINVNLNFKHEYKRLSYGVRLRYQYAFNRVSADAYDADFDQSFRIKPSLEYNLNGTKITPKVSAEFFYDPSYGPVSPGFSKFRFAAGADYEFKGPHSIGVYYQLDKRFRDYSADLRHVLNLSYQISF